MESVVETFIFVRNIFVGDWKHRIDNKVYNPYALFGLKSYTSEI